MNVRLPPHLEQFVREQLAAGRFRSEAEVIRTALQMLEQHSSPRRDATSRFKAETTGPREEATANPLSDQLHDQLSARHTQGETITDPARPRRSPRGLLADLASHISPDEIREARAETWARYHDGEA